MYSPSCLHTTDDAQTAYILFNERTFRQDLKKVYVSAILLPQPYGPFPLQLMSVKRAIGLENKIAKI
jgi:hypothetical protein